MKKNIYAIIISLAIVFTGCYTEVGYDYEREAYWDKVENKETPKYEKPTEYVEEDLPRFIRLLC